MSADVTIANKHAGYTVRAARKRSRRTRVTIAKKLIARVLAIGMPVTSECKTDAASSRTTLNSQHYI